MRVKVTQKHIKNGKNGDREFCPIALALMDKGSQCVTVLHKSCYLNGHSYRLPIVAREFILKFDRDQKVEPFEFNIRKNW